MKRFKLSTEIYYGLASLEKLSDIEGRKIFIVTDDVMINTGNVASLTHILDDSNVDWMIYDGIIPDPTMGIVKEGLDRMMDFIPDTVIALGGGSVIDGAKAMLYFYMKVLNRFKENNIINKPKLVAIPTTSGTGSEVTSYSVITDEVNNLKLPIVDDIMLPDLAILEPDFVKTVPKSVTGATGIDVLTHSIEAYVSKENSMFTDAYAMTSIKAVYGNLIRAYRENEDLQARENMQNASCMAGIAFNNSGLGITHSLAHSMGSEFHLPHGLLNGIILPYVIRFNSGIDGEINEEVARRYGQISEELGFPNDNFQVGVLSLVESINILKRELNIPMTLEEAGVQEEEFLNKMDVLAANALSDFCTPSNPIDVDEEDMRELLKKSYYG